ncbi:DNase I-like protein, partial [Cubamyces sp. BRFM 1775]
MKAHIKVATLNMKGYGTGVGGEASSKWMRLNQLVKEKRIAVLAIQEAHLDTQRAQRLQELFEQHLQIVHSADPTNSRGARGVAFVINKRLVKDPVFTATEVVPGRALLLNLRWTNRRDISLLNVYAPNAPADNMAFWADLNERRMGRVDILLGDMNIVEDPRDRTPMRPDDPGAIEALRRLCERLRLEDGWRNTHMDEVAYTYLHTNGTTQSRLDRIYAKRSVLRDAGNWTMDEPGIGTDHRLATVDIADLEAPYKGRGRWVMPKHLLQDEKMKKTMRALAQKMLNEMDSLVERTLEKNPQTVYNDFKTALTNAARARAKEKVPKMQRRLEAMREDRSQILNELRAGCQTGAGQDESRKEEMRRQAGILQDRIAKLEQKRFEAARKSTAAKCVANSETMTKSWIRANYTP